MHCSGQRSITERRSRSVGARIARSPRRPMPMLIPTVGPGTVRTQRPPPTRRSSANSSAAAAFLQRAAALTPDAGRRARRTLEAPRAQQLPGAPQAALALLGIAAAGPRDKRDHAMLQRLHGQIALDLRRGTSAIPLLLDAARRLEAVDLDAARDTSGRLTGGECRRSPRRRRDRSGRGRTARAAARCGAQREGPAAGRSRRLFHRRLHRRSATSEACVERSPRRGGPDRARYAQAMVGPSRRAGPLR